MGKRKSRKLVIMNKAACMSFAYSFLQGDLSACSATIASLPPDSRWPMMLQKMVDWRNGGIEGKTAPFKIFAMNGNQKLPFVAFSALPDVTCPGAGECLKFCYSFKAWRYPAAFCSQLQNTYLVRHGKDLLQSEFMALPQNITMRLYVDGDIDSMDTLKFWAECLSFRSDIKAYGYSKSWKIFLDYGKQGGVIPPNYMLNLSSGSNGTDQMREDMRKMPYVRGEFIAVPVSAKAHKASYGSKEYVSEVRAQSAAMGNKKTLVCGGLCGSCTAIGHACGAEAFKGITVAIGIH